MAERLISTYFRSLGEIKKFDFTLRNASKAKSIIFVFDMAQFYLISIIELLLKSYMSDFKSNVEKILQAEKERASLISKAKDRKHNTIRKARIDAEETLSEYSDALSSEVKVKEDSVQEACRNEERDILESSKKEIEETQTVSQSKKNEIVDILARYVLPN